MNNSNIAIRRTSTLKLIFLSIITFGFYWYVWLWKLITDINKIYPSKYIHRTKWFTTFILLECLSIYMDIKGIQKEFIINAADILWSIVHLTLALQILKNIENYVKDEFDIIIRHNAFGWVFLGGFYINYKINRLPVTIKRALQDKIDNLREKNN